MLTDRWLASTNRDGVGVDEENNVKLLTSSRVDGISEFIFSRKRDTGVFTIFACESDTPARIFNKINKLTIFSKG